MDISYLRDHGLILLEAISGSRAYGLATPTSDTDKKGVFILPRQHFFGLGYTSQVNNNSHDIVYFEVGRFMELLSVNNPNILELLNTPEDSLIYKNPILNTIKPEQVLSKLCEKTFGKFALSQIKKARGLNKKIVNPIEKKRKSLLSFCYVTVDKGSVPLLQFLDEQQIDPKECGLVNIPHMQGLYGLYHDSQSGYKGIIRKEHAQEVVLSSVPKDAVRIGLLYVNKDGYSTYCKEYKAYWEWVEKRNEARYQSTLSHGQQYDAKNMMHTFRLLDMAIEIALEGRINVRRPNRKFLLKIKAGEFSYETLLEMAAEKQEEMKEAFAKSPLPDKPDIALIDGLTAKIRQEIYLKAK